MVTANSREISHLSPNVVDANVRAAQTKEGIGTVMNAANGERISLNELLEVLKKITAQETVSAEYQPERKGDVKHSQADNRRAVECLGYEKRVGLEEVCDERLTGGRRAVLRKIKFTRKLFSFDDDQRDVVIRRSGLRKSRQRGFDFIAHPAAED
jgi:hypothetical protein